MDMCSESAKLSELAQNASNNDCVENEVRIEAIGDQCGDGVGVSVVKPDVVDVSYSELQYKIIEKSVESEHSEPTVAMNGMREDEIRSADVSDRRDESHDRRTEDAVDAMPEDVTQISDNNSAHLSDNHPVSNNQIVIIETVVKSGTNEVTIITESTVNTSVSTEDSSDQSSTDSTTEQSLQNNNNKNENNKENSINNNNKNTDTIESVKMTTRPKKLKSLLKKCSTDSVKSSEKRRVRFSETMQVFCDDWPQNLMPQIIALKSPTDFNLVEVQGYMFEPPVEYQDFLPFEPPEDYRDFLANSLRAYDNDMSINYIDEEGEENTIITKNTAIDERFIEEFGSKWESMILNNNESLEEEQIIGVLKEDAILQAIGSHISLPEEQLCEEDFPIHFPNKDHLKNDSAIRLAESELSDITSDDGNDSSPTGSLQDMASDSSITSQDTIILMNSDINENNDNSINSSTQTADESVNEFNDLNDSDSFSKSQTETQTDERLGKQESLDQNRENGFNTKSSDSLKSIQINDNGVNVKSDTYVRSEVVDSAPDVMPIDRRELRPSDSDKSAQNDENLSNCELNDRNAYNMYNTSDESSAMQKDSNTNTDHPNSFRRNLMFYEKMFLENNNNNKSQTNKSNTKQSHTVNHFILKNNVKLPIFTTVNSEQIITDRNQDSKQLTTNDTTYRPVSTVNNSLSSQSIQTLNSRPPTQQTQSNPNDWSTNELLIEYTSEPRALVPSKRTASLSSFTSAHIITPNQQMSNRNNSIKANTNHNISYLSLNRNGETHQWRAHNSDQHNSGQQTRLQYHQNQRSVSPNPQSTRPVSPNPRAVSPQQLSFYQNRVPYNQKFPHSSQVIPLQIVYNRTTGPPLHQRVMTTRFPTSVQTLPPPHKHPPPYSYHIQQQHNDFPNPSEIRRRDGLNAYPHVLNQTPPAGTLPVPPVVHQNQPNTQNMTKDELEQFVQQDLERTERIKKRYSFTEEDDPSFGFARRPSVRGIRPKFGSTNEILKQMQSQTGSNSQITGSHVSWPQISNNSNNSVNQKQQNHQSIQKNPQLVQTRISQQQRPTVIKHLSEAQNHEPSQAQQQSRSHPALRPSSLISQSQMNSIRSDDGIVIQVFANSNNTNRDQLKQQIQRQLEQQLQPKLHKKANTMSSISVKPVMSSNDERGAPEGASSSPKHTSDLLFTKNTNTSNQNSVKTGEMTANNSNNKVLISNKQTNDTKKLVINDENNTNTKLSQDNNEGVIYYSMNV